MMISNLIGKEFDSESVSGDHHKCIKTKVKSYGDKVTTNFQGKKISTENASYKSLSLIMLDFVITVNKKYYPKTLLEYFKYEVKKNEIENLINDHSDPSSCDNEYETESDDESKKPSKKSGSID